LGMERGRFTQRAKHGQFSSSLMWDGITGTKKGLKIDDKSFPPYTFGTLLTAFSDSSTARGCLMFLGLFFVYFVNFSVYSFRPSCFGTCQLLSVLCRQKTMMHSTHLRFIPSASPFLSRLTSSSTYQLISVIIPTLVIHHCFTLSPQAQNLPFQQILSTVDFFYLLDCLTITGLDAHHFVLVSHFIFFVYSVW